MVRIQNAWRSALMRLYMYRYLVDAKWMKQWKKYVGFDQWDQSCAGQEAANPGPVDNESLIRAGKLVLNSV